MRKLHLIAMVFVFVGCSGVRFSNAPINLHLPETFIQRTIYPKSDIWRFKLPEFTGSLLYGSNGQYDRSGRIVKDGYVPALEAIKPEDQQVYESKIDQGAAVQGSYLKIFAGGLDAKQTANILIQDTALAFISDADIPWDKLKTEALKPNPNPGTHRYWVQGALLAVVKIDNYSEVSANASGVVGDTFGAKGNVYNKQGAAMRDFRISMELVDLDKLAVLARPAVGIFELPGTQQASRDLLSRVKTGPVNIDEIRER